jgi:hypothetical protein
MLMEDKASLLKELRKETGCLVFMRSEKEDAEGTAVIKGPSFKVGPLSYLPAKLVVMHDTLPWSACIKQSSDVHCGVLQLSEGVEAFKKLVAELTSKMIEVRFLLTPTRHASRARTRRPLPCSPLDSLLHRSPYREV